MAFRNANMKVVSFKTSNITSFCALALVVTYALFLKSYFPVKHGLHIHSTINGTSKEPHHNERWLPQQTFRRTIILVIDALRTDFVLGEGNNMQFTRRILQSKNGIGLSAKTHLPTVTLPRIKVG